MITYSQKYDKFFINMLLVCLYRWSKTEYIVIITLIVRIFVDTLIFV